MSWLTFIKAALQREQQNHNTFIKDRYFDDQKKLFSDGYNQGEQVFIDMATNKNVITTGYDSFYEDQESFFALLAGMQLFVTERFVENVIGEFFPDPQAQTQTSYGLI